MVTLTAIKASNALIVSKLPAGLVAVFVGATSGIGETALREFASHANAPRIYFVGRSEVKGKVISAELQKLNPKGSYTFIPADISLLGKVDEVCRKIQAEQKTVNLLFMSPGTLVTGTRTKEDLHFFMSLSYYARVRFVFNLLPQLRQAAGLRRVVTVFAATKEGPIYTDDFESLKLGFVKGRGHISSMLTLSLATAAKQAPEISFVYTYPGFVKTSLGQDATGFGMAIAMAVTKIITTFHSVPIIESGERHTFFATSAMYPPGVGDEMAAGVPLLEGVTATTSYDGIKGGGVYTVGVDGEGQVNRSENPAFDSAERSALWEHVEATFRKVTGTFSINDKA